MTKRILLGFCLILLLVGVSAFTCTGAECGCSVDADCVRDLDAEGNAHWCELRDGSYWYSCSTAAGMIECATGSGTCVGGCSLCSGVCDTSLYRVEGKNPSYEYSQCIKCGDWIVSPGETAETCCEDVGCSETEEYGAWECDGTNRHGLTDYTYKTRLKTRKGYSCNTSTHACTESWSDSTWETEDCPTDQICNNGECMTRPWCVGEVTGECFCGGLASDAIISDGYCCSGIHITEPCSTIPDCEFGVQITEVCACAASYFDYGSCCDAHSWNSGVCPGQDVCGDGICSAGETVSSCEADCHCGNGNCDYNETAASCLNDCHCGNGFCDYLETYGTCPTDCTQVPDWNCGDGVCDSAYGETIAVCPEDCDGAGYCGDGTCQDITCMAIGCPSPETQSNCPEDCGYPATPNGGGSGGTTTTPVSVCGNGYCETNETRENCSYDCGPRIVCGNGLCQIGETINSCPIDCKAGVCGDAVCGMRETPATCPNDCGVLRQTTTASIEEPVKQTGEGICPSDEEIRGSINTCMGLNYEPRINRTSYGCSYVECMPPEGRREKICTETIDMKTGLVRIECRTEEALACPEEPQEIRQNCIESGGVPESALDDYGCRRTVCRFNSPTAEAEITVVSTGDCASADEIEDFSAQCIGQGLNPVVERNFSGCLKVNCEREEEIAECAGMPIETARRIKQECFERGGRIVREFDSTGCSMPKCVMPEEIALECIAVPEEAYKRCDEEAGKMVVKKDEQGCVVFSKCIRRGVRKISYNEIKEIPSASEVLAVAFKLEALKIEFEKLAQKSEEIGRYYRSNGDQESAERFYKVASMFETANQKIAEIKEKLRAKAANMTKDDLIEIKQDILYIKEVVLNDILFVLLGIEEEGTAEEEVDCGKDGSCFQEQLSICHPARIQDTTGPEDARMEGIIWGLEGNTCRFEIIMTLEGKSYSLACLDDEYAMGYMDNEKAERICTGSLMDKIKEMETHAIEPEIGETQEPESEAPIAEEKIPAGCREIVDENTGEKQIACPMRVLEELPEMASPQAMVLLR